MAKHILNQDLAERRRNMPITMTPTKIKQSFYLLIPKSIVQLIDVKHDTEISLSVKRARNNTILEYCIDRGEQSARFT